MVVFRKMMALMAIIAAAFMFSACERTITRVEEQVAQPLSCFECHSDQNTFLVAAEQQWQNSIHASSLNIDRGASASCAGCHISEGFVQRATGKTVTGEPNPTPIHCFTCHAPHTEGNFGLRWTKNVVLENGTTYDLHAGNLCGACHVARGAAPSGATVNINSTHWGPHHSVQGDNLIGSNGYQYSGYSYSITAHRSATANGCVDCHKNNATQNSVVGGHSFNMRWTIRLEDGSTEDVVNQGACVKCHDNIGDYTDFDFHNYQTILDSMATDLEAALTTAGLWTSGHPVQGITQVDSAGAVWNYLMYEEDRSHGVHNPKHFRGLLESSIMYLQGNLPQSSTIAQQ